MTKLTDTAVFEPRLVCSACGKPVTERELCHRALLEEADERRFLREPYDIVIERKPTGRALGLRREDPIPEVEVVVNVPHRYVVHSPTGFEFGYGGSGPADLALNILGAFVSAREAWRLHQHFKWEMIASLDQQQFRHVIRGEEIKGWIEGRWSE